jgi:A/G-specific adenine glycosylase
MRTVLGYWRQHGRHDLPWRRNLTPYRVLVSEIMLQQTQVDRVIPFYTLFLRVFPSFRALAVAPTAKLLKVWQGLGYNRRALNLRRCAQEVAGRHAGRLPRVYDELVTLSGIGPYTAGAVMAFAYDLPHPIIETNIRRVYLHHFFPRRRSVPDSEMLPFVMHHLSFAVSPRDWYSALMDYGAFLGKRSKKSEWRMTNPNRRSAGYTKQSRFAGSVRQLRGSVLRRLFRGPTSEHALKSALADARLPQVLVALQQEGFIARRKGDILTLSE